jgi:hypothetical protein
VCGIAATRSAAPYSRLLLPSFSSLCGAADRSLLWAYQFIAQLNFVRESWVAPMDVERVRPAQDANEVAAEQLGAFVRLAHEDEEEQEGAAPLFISLEAKMSQA